MYHLHFVVEEYKVNTFKLNCIVKNMYDCIKYSNNLLCDIPLYSDSSFSKSDINFIKCDLIKELKQNFKVKHYLNKSANIEYFDINNNKIVIPTIVTDNVIYVNTDNVNDLILQLYNICDFYQTLFKWRPLEPKDNFEEIFDDDIYENDEHENDIYEFY
jgi:hypothetical protein